MFIHPLLGILLLLPIMSLGQTDSLPLDLARLGWQDLQSGSSLELGRKVNTASRMESSSTPGKINLSGSTFQMIQSEFHCVQRGKISAKNKGEMNMYYLVEK